MVGNRFTFNENTGDFTAEGNVTANSDKSLKTKIEIIENAVEKVQQIRGITFERTDMSDERRYAGVIAQEVEKVLPEVILTSKTGLKSVAYGNLVGLLIEAIKEQQTSINYLKEKLK